MQGIPAVTATGVRAKAVIARHLYLRFHSDQIAEGSLDQDDDFAWAMINDLLGGTV